MKLLVLAGHHVHELLTYRECAEVMREAQSLIGALRKLNEKNLSNLMPHPLYSGFYYSHPTLLEREKALRQTLAGSPAGP